jgi:tRNA pseudouridine38-40 synthase
MRIKLVITYDGTNYHGYQIQPNGISIQEVLEGAIERATGEKVTVTASGRTDAGVHALGQVCHFDTLSTIPPDKFDRAINPHLPNDIKVLSSSLVSDDFNARRSAKRKTYAYSFYVSRTLLPLKERYSCQLEKAPDLEKIKDCKNLFVGEHDFKAFSAVGGSVKSTIRTIYSIEIEEGDSEFRILITGSGFLYNMVRIIASAMVDIGYSRLQKEDIERAFITGKRDILGKTLPAKGLTLIKVEY